MLAGMVGSTLNDVNPGTVALSITSAARLA